MALEILTNIIPTTLGGIISLAVQVLIIWIAIIIADEIIEHQISAKRSLILALLAYFIVPVIMIFASVTIPFAGIIIPLVVWIILGEIILQGSRFKDRLKVATVAFIIYLILSFLGVAGMIASLISS